MISKRRLIGSAISTLVAAGFIFQAVPSAISKTEHNGATVVEERIDNKPYQVAHVIVKARPEQVWQIITDFRNATNIFPTVKQCQIVADKGTTKIVHYQMKPTGCLATFQYDLEMKEIPHRMLSWRRLGGDFK